MNLNEHYQTLYNNSIEKIKNDDYTIDELIHSPNDNRFGITFLIRPPQEVKNEIQKFLNELRAVEPNQYYYPNPDIHITIMSIISCYNGFDLNGIDISKYVDIIKKSIAETSEIEIQFKGLTASPSCIMVQGFMANDALNDIRDNLRFHFKNSDLEQSLDKRYAIQTAHATIVRISNKLVNKTPFLNTVEAFKNCNFGTFKVDQLELVFNDWYQKEQHVKTLYRFNL